MFTKILIANRDDKVAALKAMLGLIPTVAEEHLKACKA
jgi:hypothetical protein